jgi:hypothetical protein
MLDNAYVICKPDNVIQLGSGISRGKDIMVFARKTGLVSFPSPAYLVKDLEKSFALLLSKPFPAKSVGALALRMPLRLLGEKVFHMLAKAGGS